MGTGLSRHYTRYVKLLFLVISTLLSLVSPANAHSTNPARSASPAPAASATPPASGADASTLSAEDLKKRQEALIKASQIRSETSGFFPS